MERPSQPPLEKRKAAQLAKAAYQTERAGILTALRAEAHSRKASALSQLAIEYQAKAAGLRSRFKGNELLDALAALYREQKAAERALSARLSAEARQRQRSMLRALQERRQKKRKQLREAARAAAKKQPTRRLRRRPRQRRKSAPRGPRARR